MNGDSKADILLHNSSTGDIVVWFMNGTAYLSGAYLGTLIPAWRITPM